MWGKVWTIVRETASEFSGDEVMSRAAALAYYTALGLAPTVLLVLAVTGSFGEGTQQQMLGQIESMVGHEASGVVQEVAASASKENAEWASGSISAVIGIVTVLISASGIFAQLQTTLNKIWDVETKPSEGVWNWIRARLLSIGMLFSVLFLLLVSLAITTGIAMIFGGEGLLWNLLNLAVSVVVYVLLFAMIFKFLPDAKIGWRDVWIGAGLTAICFAVGKYLIGFYLGNSAIASSYGAAGSLVAMLVWVYYSAIIVFVGAEVTQVYARHFGSGIQPSEHAVREGNQPQGSRAA